MRRTAVVTCAGLAIALIIHVLPALGEPAIRPNILIVLCDDMGYSDIGCYGGEIATPHLDQLAADGLRFIRFYNAARCCPTRASLLTGLYPHQAGMGGMIRSRKDAKTSGPYQGYLNDHCVTIAEVLRQAGYSTYMAGKWHVGEFRPGWPVDRGFDRYYGLISGGMNYFNIRLGKRKGIFRHFAVDGEEYRPPADGFYATDAFTDHALSVLREHDGERPFFLYLAYNAPHWPLHAPDEEIEKYLGKYMCGWSELRRKRHDRMVQMGLIPGTWQLSPQDPNAADWDELDEAKKREMDRKMAVYAAVIDRMDQNIGRVVDLLERMDQLDNTLVFFLSDNGACHEGGTFGQNFRPDLTGPIGTEDSYHSYGISWSNASNTPFRRHKHWVHEGGIATPLIVHWPSGFEARGQLRQQLGHVIDLMSTCVDVAGAEYPRNFKGHTVQPMEGVSLRPYFDEDRDVPRTLCWEHMQNRGIRDGSWKLVGARGGSWELYDTKVDPTELHNLVGARPDLAKKLAAQWAAWAKRVGVRNVDRLGKLDASSP
ncbi:MAG: arylsulfatase [Pirellulaceae bacterium]